MEVEFLGGAYKGRSPDMDPQECQNFFLDIDREGGKQAALVGTPGLVEFADIGIDEEIRGMLEMKDTLYVVCGYGFYSVDSDGTVTTIDSTATVGYTGAVSIAHDGTDILVSDGTYGYLYDASAGTILEISVNHDADFPGASYVTFQDGYFIVTKPSSGRFYISNSYDGTNWTATDYTTAGAHPDYVAACISDHSNLWIFGNESIEIYYNSGASFPFDRIEGAFIETGIKSADSLAQASDTLFWLDSRLQVRKAVGLHGEVISTPQIEYQFQQYTTTSDAIGYAFNYEGHTLYVLQFPSENETWAYDLRTNMWLRLASYPTLVSDKTQSRHRSNCYAWFASKHLVGDYENGKIYYFDGNTYTDDGETITRVRVGRSLQDEDRKMLFYHAFEILLESGVGLQAARTIWNCAVAYVANDVVTHQRLYSGAHDGSADASALTDSSQSWGTDELKGMRINNTTDGSSGFITANTATTVTATLSGGTDNDWDVSDTYVISDDKGVIYKCTATSTGNEPPNASYWESYEGADPQIMLQWSDDRGHTWSNEHWASMGMSGQYGLRARWRKLGCSRHRVPKIKISDPVKVVILGAFADVERGIS